jgi:hypothetical protein
MLVTMCDSIASTALTIALFYSLGTLLGGVVGPWLFGVLIGGEGTGGIVWGHLLGAALMIAAAAVELWLGVAAEGKSLEDVAPPCPAAPDRTPPMARH